MESLASLLSANSHLSLTPQNKIKCSISGHEMPPRADIVRQYLSSNALKKSRELKSFDISAYLPHIVPAKDDPNKLFCKLTKQSLNRVPEKVLNHVNGKRFKRLKAEAEALSKAGWKKKSSEDADTTGNSDGFQTNTAADDDDNDGDDDDEVDFWVSDI